MFDTHAIARRLVKADFTEAQADALTDAIREAAAHGDYVTPELLDARLAGLRADIYRAMLIQAGAIVGSLVSIAGIVVAALRLWGS